MVFKETDLDPLEFTVAVTNEDIYRLDNYKIQLKKLFDVQLAWKREEILSLSHEQDNQWFYITEGSAKARQLAKEYIKAVFQPEITQVINADIYGCLNLADEIEDIQRTSGACITQLNEELFEIKGSEMAATLACSKFEQAIGVFQNNNKIVENNFPDGTENELKFYGLKRSEVKEDLRKVEELNNINQKDLTTTDQEQRCDTHFAESNETTHGLVRQTNILCSTAVVGCSDLKEPNVSENPENLGDFPDKSDADSGCEKLDQEQETLSSQSHDNVETDSEPTTMRVRDFAAKLGYKESEISSAMEKLGPEADKNAILLELVNAQASMKQLEEGPSGANFKSIVSTPKISDPDYLRPIVIDGSNVAMSHGNQRVFSCRGIGIAVDWFLQHGHREITVFVPQWRKEASKTNSPIINQEVLRRLEDDHFLKWTPARIIRGRRITCYDDRYIVQLASENDGVIVSNDAFRDLENECPEFKKVIEQRLLMYTFVNDRFMPPDDPLGRHGPKLKEFLRKGMGQLCPYGRKCTYGKRCKYLHQERNSKSEAELTAGLVNGDQSLPVLPEIPYGDTRPIESHPIQSRPLPPLPEQQIPANILSKPLPLPPNPYLQTAFNMSQLFPPTLRSNGQSNTAVRQIKTMSDPTPTSQEFDDVQEQMVCRNFHRIMSMPSLDGASMGPAPQLTGHPSPHGNQSHIVTGNGTFATSIYPHNHPDVLSGRMPMHPVPPHAGGSRPTSGEWLPDEAYGACGGYQLYSAQPPPVPPRYHNNQPLPNQASNYDMAGNHWGMSYSQQPHGYPLPYQFTQGNLAYYDRTYSRTPYHGQGNTFFRSRAPPIVGNYEVTDNPGSQDELRIKAYEKLTEVFPESGEKILKILDDHPEVSDIKELMEYMLEEKDK